MPLEVENTQLQTAVEKPIIINYVDIDEVSDEVVKEVIIQIKEKRNELNLKTILNNPDPIYQVLLKTKVLANKDRVTFSKSLIRHILVEDEDRKIFHIFLYLKNVLYFLTIYRLTREDFHNLSSIIVTDIFPEDLQGAWFTPA